MKTIPDTFAFPVYPLDKGLTKREYFAAMAMQGILSDPEKSQKYIDWIAKRAVECADALIKELNKENP